MRENKLKAIKLIEGIGRIFEVKWKKEDGSFGIFGWNLENGFYGNIDEEISVGDIVDEVWESMEVIVKDNGEIPKSEWK